MKHIILSLVLLLGSLGAVAGTTYDFSTSIPKGWTASVAPKGYETTGDARGTQFEQSSSLTLSGVSNVTEVTIVASSNMENTHTYTLSVSVGNKPLGSYTLDKVTNETFAFSGAAADGDLVVTITKNGKKKSLWIKSITVEGNVPAQEDPADRLDPDYIYPADPVMILPKDSLGKMEIDTIINNILLTCAQGAYYKTDIRVMANGAITFTATKPIKAIRIDGGNRKAFSASASAGTLTYAVDYEADIENAAPVLLIKDIDEPSVKLTCDKQLQMQKIYIYFDANPDVEIDTGEEDVVAMESCPVSSTGAWNFVAEYTNREFLWTVGSVKFVLWTNPEWQMYSDGYVYGEGGGVQFNLDLNPSNLLDWSGTYTVGEGINDYYTYAYEYIPGATEDEDQAITYMFAEGSVTLTANGDNYDLAYSLKDTDGILHTGSVISVCSESGQPQAIETIEVPLDTKAPMFNILGQPVDASYEGIIIQNNHKYLKTRL